MSIDDQFILIRKCSLWSDLSEAEYKELDVQDNFKEVRKGEYIYFEAYNHNTIYFIKKGNILLGKIDDSGLVITKEILKPGDFFGQFILEKNSLDGEFAQAIKSDVSLCSFNIETFAELLKKNPTLSIKYTKLVGLRLKRFENRFLNIIHKDVRTRLLLFMRDLLNEYHSGRPFANVGTEVPNLLTHEEIAQLIGTSRQTVSMFMSKFKEEGVLEYSRKKIKFLNLSENSVTENQY